MNIKIHNPNNLPTIDYREVEEFQGNLKDLTKDNYAKLKKSIEENGFFIPMFLWKHEGKFKVLDAHQRLRVLKKENVQPYEIPYIEIEAKDEQEAKKKLLLISSQYGTITQEGLDEFAFDLDKDWMADTINFDNVFDFDKIEVEEDDYEVPDKIKTDIKLGDLFQLGDHRLLCGDATKKEDVERLMDEQKAILMITDPPYGVNYDPEWRIRAGINTSSNRMGKVINDDIIDWGDVYSLFDTQIIYVWYADCHAKEVQGSLEKFNYQIICQIVWVKDRFVLGKGNYHWQHECCLYGVKKGQNHYWQGDRKQKTVWEINKIDRNEEAFGHGTQKPIECMAKPIRNNSKKNDIIVDPFLGSGTTMIAAEQLNRKCYGMEISPEYCQIIIDRWEEFTNQKSKIIN